MRRRIASAALMLAFVVTMAGTGGLLIESADDCFCVIKSPCCTGTSCPLKPKRPSFAACHDRAEGIVRPRLVHRIAFVAAEVKAIEPASDDLLAREPEFRDSEFVESPWRPPRASFLAAL